MHIRTAVVSALIALSVSQPLTSLAASRTPDHRRQLSRSARSFGAHASARLVANAPRVYGPASRVSVPDGAGGLYISWADIRDGSGDIFLLRVTSSGAVAAGWPADGLPVCNAVGDQFESVMVPDGSNGVIVGWLDFRDSWQIPDGYAQRVNSAGTALWTANGVKVKTSALVEDAVIAPDGTGGMLGAWSATGATDKDIFAIRFTSTGALASGWSASGNVVCSLAEDQVNVSVTNDGAGAGGSILAWEDGRAGGGETHIYTQRLDASGAEQWTPNGILLDTSPVGALEPIVCSDGGTGALIFWIDFTSSDPILGQHVNSSGIVQWNVGGLGVGGSASLDGFMGAVADGMGGAVITWDQSPGTIPGLRVQRVDGAGAEQWGATGVAIVGIANSNPYLTDIVPDGAGAAYFLWEDSRNGSTPHNDPDIFAQRVSATGVLWAANGVGVCTSGGEQYMPTGAIDGGSLGLVVAWQDQRGLDTDIFAQHYTSAGAAQLAANGVAVFRNPGVQVGEFVLQTNDGGAIVFGNQKFNNQWDIRARKFNSDGSPAGPSVSICNAAGHQGISSVIDDGNGGAIVAWTDRRSGGEDIYAQRVDVNCATQWTANGVAICTASGAQGNPRMVTDGAGGAILAWQDNRNAPDADVYAQRVNNLGVVQWTPADGVPVCTNPNNQAGAVIASDNAFGAIIAWGDYRSFLGPAVYAQRLNSSGVAQWTPDGLSIAAFPIASFATVTDAVPGTANDAIILISQPVVDLITFNVTSILRAQKVSSAGMGQWGAMGAPVCDASSICSREHMIEDGGGGAYVAWSDGRNDIFDVYMQRVDGTGAVQWTPNGEVVCDAVGWQHLDGLTRDPSGDEFLTWEDQRGGQPNIYAQRVNTSGASVWAANGVQVCGATRGQFFSTIAQYKAASPARLFVAWTDDRAATERYVFLQRLDLAGNSQWTPDGVTRTTLAMVSTSAETDRVRLVWFASDHVAATVYRRTEDQDWQPIGEAASDGTGLISFEDRDVVPGTRYGYRLEFFEAGQQTFAGEVWVEVPTNLQFALDGLQPNPAVDALVVSFTLPTGDAATLEMLDVAGRRVLTRDLTGLAPGRHTLRLDGDVPPAGVYFIKLTQKGRTITGRAAVLH